MQDIVICETDPSLLAVLVVLLEDDGLVVTPCATSSALLLHLNLRALRATVLFDHYDTAHQHQDLFLTTLVNDRALQRQHAYILMTTNPLSEATQDLLARLHIAIVYKPFEIEDLLTTIRLAASPDMPSVA